MEAVYIALIVLILVFCLIFGTAYLSARKKLTGAGHQYQFLESELLTAKRELGIEKNRLVTILDTIDTAVVILDAERLVTALNKAAENLFKTAPGSAIGKTMIILSHDHEMDDLVQKAIDSEHEQKASIQSSGNKQFLQLTARPLNVGAVLLIRDVTDIRKLEKVRRDFIANISHELRTPIASCKAIVETLQDGAINYKNIAKDFLQRMHVEIDKLAQMVDELGELSRIENGELKLKLAPVDIHSLADKVAGRLKTQADLASVTIKINIPGGVPEVTADADRLEQVLMNLIHNAIKFTPRSGTITVSSVVHDQNLMVSVLDTGIGIPEDDLPHIFERFYKVDKARSGGGTGLGLSIAKHIIEAHGGEIQAESEEGKGSLFIFSIPLAGSPVLNTNLRQT